MTSKRDPLEDVIEAINEAYKGNFTEGDRVLIGTLREKLLADKKLRKAAKSDGQQMHDEVKSDIPMVEPEPKVRNPELELVQNGGATIDGIIKYYQEHGECI